MTTVYTGQSRKNGTMPAWARIIGMLAMARPRTEIIATGSFRPHFALLPREGQTWPVLPEGEETDISLLFDDQMFELQRLPALQQDGPGCRRRGRQSGRISCPRGRDAVVLRGCGRS